MVKWAIEYLLQHKLDGNVKHVGQSTKLFLNTLLSFRLFVLDQWFLTIDLLVTQDI